MFVENKSCFGCDHTCLSKEIYPDCNGVAERRVVFSGYMEVKAYFPIDGPTVRSRKVFDGNIVNGLSGKQEMETEIPVMCFK